MPSGDKNPTERRLDILYEQWDAFVQNPRARLLRWVIEGDEQPMIEAFLTVESDEDIGHTPDLFIRFSSAFSKPADHGFILLRELIGQYAAAQDALREDGLSVHWQPPPIRKTCRDIFRRRQVRFESTPYPSTDLTCISRTILGARF
jgi:hypothetical protein